MSSDTIDVPKKRFLVFICEIKQELVWAEEFSDKYTRNVSLSDGRTRTIELTPVIHDGRDAILFNDTGRGHYMELIPVRNNVQVNGNLMVRVLDMDDMETARAQWESRQPASPVLPLDTSLISIPAFVPPGFIQGIEILNDNKTQMNFVVDALRDHAGLSEEQATELMLAIHRRGGALIPTASAADAQRIASAITAAAAQRGFPLICRPVAMGVEAPAA